MSTLALSRRRRCTGGPTIAAVSGSALVALGIVSVQSEWASFGPWPSLAAVVDIVAGLLSIVLLFAVRHSPVRIALLLSALLTVSAAATPAAGTATLWVAQRRRLPVAIGVALAGVAGHLIRAAWRPTPDRSMVLWTVVIAASYAALVGWGAQNQAKRALVASLEDRAQRAEEDQAHRIAEARRAERTKIAREMHDVLAHRLSLLAAYAGALEFRPDAPPAELARAAGVIRDGAHQALEELREVIGVLREDPAEQESDRPQPTLSDLPRLLDEARAAGTPVRLDDRLADPGTVPDVLGRTVYRVVQEGLTNVRKHAPGQEATVLLGGRRGRNLLVVVLNRTARRHRRPGPDPGQRQRARRPAGAGPAGRRPAGREVRPRAVPALGGAAVAGVRVLVVDDDALVRGALRMMLSGSDGIEVVGEAGDGDEVDAALAEHRPDVVLMDIRMPRLDGISATAALRRRPDPPYVIVLTTFDADENVLRALRAGPAGSCSRTPRRPGSSRPCGGSRPARRSSRRPCCAGSWPGSPPTAARPTGPGPTSRS